MAAEMHLPTIPIAFPLSIPIYFGGAILVSIIYFFVLLPFLYCLIAVEFLEPLTQGGIGAIQQHGWIAVPSAVCDLTLNLGQVWLLRRGGLVAAILFRVGYRAVWHVLYGLV